VRYAALSYCWGPPTDAKKQCKTEHRSLDARLRAIPVQELSPVVRDAVVVARRLSIPYLWVDALCIIQDDRMDWENAFSLMGLVISNAYITISSLSSSTCQSGFLQRSPHISETNLPGEMLEDWLSSPWSTRGWTFQEEKLSMRLIYFGRSKVHFCCSNWIYTEGGSTSSTVYEKSIIDLGRDALVQNHVQLLVDFWRHGLVPQYSRRQFTRAKDKLPAIAGVAKYIGDVTGYDYVAGMWKPGLFTELIWLCHCPPKGSLTCLLATLATDSSTFIAPSWSWAHFVDKTSVGLYFIEGETQWLNMEAKVKVSITWAGPNVYGEILSGELAITTKVLRVLPDHCQFVTGGGYDRASIRRTQTTISFIPDWSCDDMCEEVGELELVLIGSYRVAENQQKRFYGVMVHATPIPGKYYRVGVFDSTESERHGLNFEEAEVKEIIVF
jgi:hypothetical protein